MCLSGLDYLRPNKGIPQSFATVEHGPLDVWRELFGHGDLGQNLGPGLRLNCKLQRSEVGTESAPGLRTVGKHVSCTEVYSAAYSSAGWQESSAGAATAATTQLPLNARACQVPSQ